MVIQALEIVQKSVGFGFTSLVMVCAGKVIQDLYNPKGHNMRAIQLFHMRNQPMWTVQSKAHLCSKHVDTEKALEDMCLSYRESVT